MFYLYTRENDNELSTRIDEEFLFLFAFVLYCVDFCFNNFPSKSVKFN